MKNCRYEKGTGNREQGTGNRGQGTGNRLRRDGFGQLDFSLLMSVFSVHLLRLSLFLQDDRFMFEPDNITHTLEENLSKFYPLE
ncbi:MAG: hypothetical protein ACK55G_06240, partial [Dolichospermum sp.]